MTGISTLSLIMHSSTLAKGGQATLSHLNEQLASGKKSTNLVDYTSYEARKILNGRAVTDKYESYIGAIDSVMPRLKVYDASLESMETIVGNMQQLIRNAGDYESAIAEGLEAQVETFTDQIEYYLNQKVADRFIFAGARYTTKPVGDIQSTSLPPVEAFPAADPNLPPWDGEYNPPTTTTNAAAFIKLSATIDDDLQVTYGITSTDRAIQDMIEGMRWALAAVNDSVNYDTYMQNASDFLDDAKSGIRRLRAEVVGDQRTLTEVRKNHQNSMTMLKVQIDGVQNVDINEVATKISFYQSQLQASFAATGRLASMSILDYI